jgi:hypothetical protein
MPNRVAGYPQEIRARGNKSQREAVRRGRERLLAGQQYRSAVREDVWLQSERQYEGQHWDNPAGLDQIVVNLSFSTVNVIAPYMVGNEPNFLVVPYGHGANPRNAAIQQAFLNRIWRGPDVNGQQELESASVDFIVYGDGYLKVGYDIAERRVDSDERTYAEMAELWVLRASPWDIWVDPTADGIHNARWVCHRLRFTREELKELGYKNIDEDNVSYGNYHRITEETKEGNRTYVREALDGTDYAILYEFYDLVEKYKVVFADGGDAPLQYVEDLPVVPIVQMGNYRIPSCPYHMGDLEQVWEIQQELNKTRSQMIQHRARNVQKFVALEGKLGANAIEALKSPVVNEVVYVKGDMPLESLIAPLQVPNLSSDVYNISQIVQQDIYEISGVNEYLRGAAPNIRRTATEATIIEGASNVKSQFKLRQAEKAVRKVGTLLLSFAADVYPQTDFEEMQLYLTGRDAELVLRNTPEGDRVDEYGEPLDMSAGSPDVVISPTPEIWEGTYEVLVEQSSTELRNPVMREQKYRGMVMDLLGAIPMLGEMGVTLDIRKLLELWFEAAGIDDVEGLFGAAVPMGPTQEAPMEGEDALAGLDPSMLEGILGGGGGEPGGVPMDAITEANSGILEAVA